MKITKQAKQFLSGMIAVAFVLSNAVSANNLNTFADSAFSFMAEISPNTIKVNNTSGISKSSGVLEMYADNVEIERDFDQTVNVYVTNAGDKDVTYHLEISKKFPDLPINFIEAGSDEQDITIKPGDVNCITLKVFAQGAESDHYSIPIIAVSEDELVAEATLELYVPTIGSDDISIEEVIGLDLPNCTRRIRVSNISDKRITGVVSSLSSDDCLFYSNPMLSFADVEPGESVEMDIYPDLTQMAGKAIDKASVNLVVSAGGVNFEKSFEFTADGEINIITVGKAALIKDGNPFAEYSYVPNSAKVTLNGASIFQSGFGSIYDENGVSCMTAESQFKDKEDNISTITFSTKIEPYTGELTEIPENGISSSKVMYDDSTDTLSVEFVFLNTRNNGTARIMSLKSAAEDVANGVDEIAQITVRTQLQNAAELLDGKCEEIFDCNLEELKDKAVESGWDWALEDVDGYNEFCEFASSTIEPIINNIKEVNDGLDFVDEYLETITNFYDTLNNPNAQIEEKLMGIFEGYSSLCGLDESIGGSDELEAAKSALETFCEGWNEFWDDVWSWIKEQSRETARVNMRYSLSFRSQKSQCSNAGESKSEVNYNGKGARSKASSYNDIYISHRLYREGYCADQETVNYRYKVNGVDCGTNQSANLTAMTMTHLEDVPLNYGNNVLVADFDVNPGHYMMLSDMNISIPLDSDDLVGYIGDKENIPEVRSLPDYAIYTENIYSDNSYFTDGETAEFKYNVYNLGLASGYVQVDIYNDSLKIDTQTIFIPAFSSYAGTFTAVCGKSTNIFIRLTDLNTFAREVVENDENNYASRTFKSCSENIKVNANTEYGRVLNEDSPVAVSNNHTFIKLLFEDAIFDYGRQNRIEGVNIICNGTEVEASMTSIPNAGSGFGQLETNWNGSGTRNVRYMAYLDLKDGENSVEVEYTYRNGNDSTKTETLNYTLISGMQKVALSIASGMQVKAGDAIYIKSADGLVQYYADAYDENGQLFFKLPYSDADFLFRKSSTASITIFFGPNDEMPATALESADNDIIALSGTWELNKGATLNKELTSHSVEFKASDGAEFVNVSIFPINAREAYRFTDARINLPEWEYDYSVTIAKDGKHYVVYGHMNISDDKIVDIQMPAVSDTDTITVIINADSISDSTVYINAELDGGIRVSLEPENGKVNVPANASLNISVFDQKMYYTYFIGADKITENAMFELSTELTGELVTSGYNDYNAGDEINFYAENIKDSKGNSLRDVFAVDGFKVSGILRFTNTADATDRYEVTLPIENLQYFNAVLPIGMNGEYNAALFVNVAPADDKNDSSDSNNSGNTGSSGSSGNTGGSGISGGTGGSGSSGGTGDSSNSGGTGDSSNSGGTGGSSNSDSMGGSDNSGNTSDSNNSGFGSSNNSEDESNTSISENKPATPGNPNTGITVVAVPMLIVASAAVIIVSKKKK